MKVERWEEETDEEWAERLTEEIAIANNTEISEYFVERDSYAEDSVIINYIGEDAWTWKEHPEGPFKATQIIEWKNKAEKWNELVAGQFKYQVVPMKDHVEVLGTLDAVKAFIKPYYDNYPSKADHYEQEIIEGTWKILVLQSWEKQRMIEKEIIEKVRWVFEENADDLLDRSADPELIDTVCEFGSALLGLDVPLYNLQELVRRVTKVSEVKTVNKTLSWYEDCVKCRTHDFRIEFTRDLRLEVACRVDWYCSKCGTHAGGILSDPLNEVKASQFIEKGDKDE